MDWFRRLVGFSEEGMAYEEIRSQFALENVLCISKHQHESSSSRPAADACMAYGPVADVVLTSKANGRRMIAGRFEAVSLAQLRERVIEVQAALDATEQEMAARTKSMNETIAEQTSKIRELAAQLESAQQGQASPA